MNTVKTVLISNFPLPFLGIASWTTRINYHLSNDCSIDYLICPKSKNINFEIGLPNGFSIKSGNYYLDILIYDFKKSYFEEVVSFELLNDPKLGYKEDIVPRHHGKVYVPNNWIIE